MAPGLLYRIYTTVTSIVVPVAFPIALFFKRGRIRSLERLGFWEGETEPFDWWFHGASLGEVNGIIPLIKSLRIENPTCRILLTATSPTGLVAGEGIVDSLRILPFDAPWCIRRALRAVKVNQLVVTED